MRKPALVLAMIGIPLTPLQAQSMPVSEFLAKADALQAKGMMAMFSSDLGVLKSEWKRSAAVIRAQQAADAKAGRKATLCMPKKAAVNSDEVLAYLRGIPPQRRDMTFTAALAGMVRKKYPCPA